MPEPRDGGLPPVVAVVGPTAVGKSDLAVELALRCGGEVVNADSMQLYRGMDIGTAKLTEPERRGVPHHLLDMWDVTEAASVAEYQRMARQVVSEVRSRDSVPILVGGSGLYVSAVLEPLDFPGTDAKVRVRLEAELDEHGPAHLHARLAQLDPEAARGILRSNGRRIVRALEVVELTGSYSANLPRVGGAVEGEVLRIGLTSPREVLDQRVDARVERMWAAGLVEEVRGLVEVGLRRGVTASRALGYAQVLRLLDGGLTDAEARADTAARTRRFVRRQESWFRRDASIEWHDAAAVDVDRLVARITGAPDATRGPA